MFCDIWMQEYEKGYGSGPYGIREVNLCHSVQILCFR